MKITKRLLVVLLMAALLVPCLLLSVSAEDSFGAEGISDIEDVMEYYALDYYFGDDYENGSWSGDYYTGAASMVVNDPLGSNNKVLKVTGKSNKYSNKSVTDKLVFSFDVCYDTLMEGQYNVDIKMIHPVDAAALTYNTMFSVNARDGEFQHSVWDPSLNNGEGGFVVISFDGITPQPNQWYNVVIFFNAAENNYNFKISDNGKQSWVFSDSYSLGGATMVSSFELTADAVSRSDTVSLYLDNVEVYCGTFERDPANCNDVTAQTLIDLETLYLSQDTPFEDKVRIAEVFKQIVFEYEYVPADSTADLDIVKEIISLVPVYVNRTFAEEFIRRADAIDIESGYYNRTDFVEESSYYTSSLPANDSLASAPAFSTDAELVRSVIAARERFEQEKADLVKVERDSIAFVKEMLTYDSANKDYDGYLKGFYDKLASYAYKDFTYAESIDDLENFTMADAVLLYEEFDAKYTKLNDAANTFIKGTQMMALALEEMEKSAPHQDAYEVAFANLAEGFILADSVYNGGDIDANLDESTHALLSGLFSVYTDNKDSVVAEIELCQFFISTIKNAKTATYYTAIVGYLTVADECVDNVREKYKGVPEALSLYRALKEAVAGEENACEAYKKAVEAVVVATSFADKQGAIEAALALKAEGDVIGVEGVAEANIKLSEEMTKVQIIIDSSNSLKALVPQIEAATSFAERRALLARAEQAAVNAELSIDGVADAIARLDLLVDDYASTINGANKVHMEANRHAADLAGATSQYTGVYKAADIIKDFIG